MKKNSLLFIALAATMLVACNDTPLDRQPEGSPVLSVNTRTLEFDAFSTVERTVTVNSGGAVWALEFDAEANPWLHVTQKSRSIAFSVDNNETLGKRTAVVTVTSRGNDPIEITVSQSTLAIRTAIGDYLANLNYPELADPEINGGEFVLGLASTELDENRNPAGDGFLLFLNFIAPAPELNKSPVIEEGTYEAAGLDITPYSIITGRENTAYSEIRFFIDGAVTNIATVEDGSFTVTKTGNEYTLDFDLTFSDGTVFNSSWTGPIATVHQNYISTHNEDVSAVMRGGAGVIDSWGDVWNSMSLDGSWEWDAWFWGEGIVWGGEMNRNPVGYGDLMRITILADQPAAGVDPDLLPPGTYAINGTGRRNTAVWGGWDGRAQTYTGIWGSWYIDYNNLMTYPDSEEPLMGALVDGTITVEYNPSTQIYNIVVDAVTDAGKSVDIDFEGPLSLNVSTVRRN